MKPRKLTDFIQDGLSNSFVDKELRAFYYLELVKILM